MIFRKTIILVFFFMSTHAVIGQFKVDGTVKDKSNSEPLPNANIILMNASDTTLTYYGSSDWNGKFQLQVPSKGQYQLRIYFLGYKVSSQFIQINIENNPVGEILLEPATETVGPVNIEGQMPVAIQQGDTTQYNADAFKVNKDANAEDLISKMPGITVEGGVVKAQGEDVKKVLVDGKEFFGDDANMALKNIPAEIIDKIQVFDKLSDQSEFTGFDDGNASKTINIVTKKDMRNGQFGKFFGGLGSDYRYHAGINLNLFDADRRITILGMSNNINLQNFSSEDLAGVSNTSSQRGGGGRGYMGSSNASNFMLGTQSGIASTHSAGINYQDAWGKKKKINFTGSYFFNYSENFRDQLINREYSPGGDSAQVYSESSKQETQNYNHRVNMNFEFKPDSMNTIQFKPRFSLQQNNSSQFMDSETRMLNTALNQSATSRFNDKLSWNAGGDLEYRHRFKKTGRTISINSGGNYTFNLSDYNLYSSLQFFSDSLQTNDSLNQQTNQNSSGYRINGNIAYTEPIGKKGILILNHFGGYDHNSSIKNTFNYNPISNTHNLQDTSLSNEFSNTNITNRFNVGYRLRTEKFNLSFNIAYQNILFRGTQSFPFTSIIDRIYHNALPGLFFNYRFSRTSNLRISYRTSTRMPSVSQLQQVIDNSNPLLLNTGNSQLIQDFTHSAVIRYNRTNTEKGNALFFSVAYSYTHDYIANSTLIASADTVVADSIFLGRGTQLSRPVNLDGYMSARSLFTYSFPLKKIKSTINLNTSASYSRMPGLINSDLNFANSVTLGQGIVWASNISEKLDFTLSYNASYNFILNSLRSQRNNNYFNQSAIIKFNWQFWKGFVFNTQLHHSYFNGLASGFDQNVFLWNASLSYKFLKDESLELKAGIFDILSQNQSVAREVNETYIEDRISNVLTRYVMVTLTYNLRNFAKSTDHR